jgi:hypothetical protein
LDSTERGGKEDVAGWRAAVFWISLVGGCAGDPPKPAPAVTPEQVRGHADKTFEKLKQEEQQRGGDPGTPR